MKTVKNGISLVTLVITILVGIILVSVSIVTVNDSINEAKKAAFAEELSVIEDQSLLYYLQNGEEYPAYKNEDETLISKTPSEIKGIVGDKKFSSLIEEMKLNKENGEENITEDTQLAFYVIDLDKLSLDKKTRGIKKDGSEEDVYVISAKTNRVYYLKGEKIGGKTYYSLANLMKYTNKVTSEEDNQVEVIEVGSLIVKRAKKTWTNTLGITIQVKDTLSTTNTINVTAKNGETGEVIVTSSFEMESEYTIKKPLAMNFNVTEIIKFCDIDKKILEFSRGEDTVILDVSNYDAYSPDVDLDNLTKNIATNGNVLTFKVKDLHSGIKEVKYDYLQIYDENGELQNYYKDTEKLDASFVKARGKKADISAPDENGYVTVTIKVPFNVEGIQVCTTDKAGNTDTSTIGVYDFDNDPYIGCELKSISNAGLTFKAVFNTNDSNKKLTKYTAKVSTDNTTYTGDYSETLSTSKEKYSKLINDYKNGIQIEKKVYVKISATIAGVVYERIFEFDIADGDKLKNDLEDGSMLIKDYNVSSSSDSSETVFLRSGVVRKDITGISFEKGVVPETYDYKFDASIENDNSILGYVIREEDNTDKAHIVFSSDKTIYANYDSSYYFKDINCTIEFNNFDTSKVTNMSGMFYQFKDNTGSQATHELDVSNFDTSNVTNMRGMFYQCRWLEYVDLSSFDTSKVTNMASMFYGCKLYYNNLDLSSFNTSKVTDMSYMFTNLGERCTSYSSPKTQKIDVSSFDTSNVTNMRNMFAGCKVLITLDVSNFDTSNVTDMSGMFCYCENLKIIDVSKFNTANVTNMNDMFRTCLVNELDLSNWNTSKVENMCGMFYGSGRLATIYASDKFVTTNVVKLDGDAMFWNNYDLVGGNGTKYSNSCCGIEYARIDKSGQIGYFTAK